MTQVNTTSRASFRAVASACTSDVMCCQEVKLPRTDVEEVSDSLFKEGWKAAISPSVWTGGGRRIGDKRMLSGGVAILAKRHLDVWPRPMQMGEEANGRVAAANLQTQDLGWIVVYSVTWSVEVA